MLSYSHQVFVFIEDENWSLNLCLHFPTLLIPASPDFSSASATFSGADNPVTV
jgi:hypothetical protein